MRLYLLFIFFTLFFLFYPGDSLYFHIFAYHREIFSTNEPMRTTYNPHPVPFITYPSSPEVSAEGIYVVDLPSFTPILEKNDHQTFLPASTTKIITALVACDLYQPDDILSVRRVVNDGQTMGLVLDEKMSVENLLYGTLVHSGNDAAYVFADNYGYDAFVDLMNKKAKTLGMRQSHFTNPAGLDDPAQQTTPFDLALASRALLRNRLLKQIVATKEITISDADFKYFHRLSNVNKLLGEIQGIGGLKTGYTENAGENLVSFYKKNGHEFVIVLLKSKDRFADTKTIVSWINDAVDYQSIDTTADSSP